MKTSRSRRSNDRRCDDLSSLNKSSSQLDRSVSKRFSGELKTSGRVDQSTIGNSKRNGDVSFRCFLVSRRTFVLQTLFDENFSTFGRNDQTTVDLRIFQRFRCENVDLIVVGERRMRLKKRSIETKFEEKIFFLPKKRRKFVLFHFRFHRSKCF